MRRASSKGQTLTKYLKIENLKVKYKRKLYICLNFGNLFIGRPVHIYIYILNIHKNVSPRKTTLGTK